MPGTCSEIITLKQTRAIQGCNRRRIVSCTPGRAMILKCFPIAADRLSFLRTTAVIGTLSIHTCTARRSLTQVTFIPELDHTVHADIFFRCAGDSRTNHIGWCWNGCDRISFALGMTARRKNDISRDNDSFCVVSDEAFTTTIRKVSKSRRNWGCSNQKSGSYGSHSRESVDEKEEWPSCLISDW